jgi:hypothetical protein
MPIRLGCGEMLRVRVYITGTDSALCEEGRRDMRDSIIVSMTVVDISAV